MILIFDNMLCIVLEKLEHLGPEPHYKVCFKNKLGAVAVQPSGRVVGYEEDGEKYNHMESKYIHYFTSLKYLETYGDKFLHRECGPAYVSSEKHNNTMYDYHYEEHRKNGEPHRENGPAIIELWGKNGRDRKKEEYWIDGQRISYNNSYENNKQ